MLKRLMIVLMVCFGLSGCYIEEAEAQVPITQGCFITEQPGLGEMEVCNAYYYVDQAGYPVYWSPEFNIWVGAGVWWGGGYWHAGFHNGWWGRYHGSFYGHGYYGGRGWNRGYYRGHVGGYGGYHGGGGRGFGGHGGHR
jgi:hypothetical protein